jgi:hypothetical protein
MILDAGADFPGMSSDGIRSYVPTSGGALPCAMTTLPYDEAIFSGCSLVKA